MKEVRNFARKYVRHPLNHYVVLGTKFTQAVCLSPVNPASLFRLMLLMLFLELDLFHKIGRKQISSRLQVTKLSVGSIHSIEKNHVHIPKKDSAVYYLSNDIFYSKKATGVCLYKRSKIDESGYDWTTKKSITS